MNEITREMQEASEEKVRVALGQALYGAFGDNSGPFVDEPYHFGIVFPDGSFVDVAIDRKSVHAPRP